MELPADRLPPIVNKTLFMEDITMPIVSDFVATTPAGRDVLSGGLPYQELRHNRLRRSSVSTAATGKHPSACYAKLIKII